MKTLTILKQVMSLHAKDAHMTYNPEDYAAAGGELLVISMILSWILTYLFDYQIIEENNLQKRVGYNNLCVGWDEAPAKIVAAPIFVVIIWMECRYMQLDFWRAAIDTSSSVFQDQMVLVANFFNAISWMVCILIFVVPPTENPTLHTFSFVQLVVFGYFAYLANFLETAPRYHPKGSYVFIVVFGFFSVMFGACAVIQFSMWDEETQTPGPVPWYITATGDYGWFACLGVQGYMRPRAPSVSMSFKLVSDDDYKVLGAAENGASREMAADTSSSYDGHPVQAEIHQAKLKHAELHEEMNKLLKEKLEAAEAKYKSLDGEYKSLKASK